MGLTAGTAGKLARAVLGAYTSFVWSAVAGLGGAYMRTTTTDVSAGIIYGVLFMFASVYSSGRKASD